MYISIAAMTWRFFSLISYMFEFFHVAQYTTSFVTYYIKLQIFQKAYRVY